MDIFDFVPQDKCIGITYRTKQACATSPAICGCAFGLCAWRYSIWLANKKGCSGIENICI